MFNVSSLKINNQDLRIDSKSTLLKLPNQFILDATESNKPAKTIIMKRLFALFFLILSIAIQASGQIQPDTKPTIVVQKTQDFDLTGDGSAGPWNQTEWIDLTQRNLMENTLERNTKMKLLYSETGLYVLFQNEDSLVTTPFTEDFENLWLGDVVEVFLWTNQSEPDYFEYEVTPLNYELLLIVSNIDGELLSWIPFENTYREGRKVRHKTAVTNGEKKNGASIDAWTAEFFIPFKLLHPLKNIDPQSGTTWRANFYRIDYDDEGSYWSWSPFEGNFHDYQNFGVLIFE